MRRRIPAFCDERGLPSLISPFNKAVEKTSLLSLRGGFCRSNLLPLAQTIEIASLENTRNDEYLAFSTVSIREVMWVLTIKHPDVSSGLLAPPVLEVL